MNDDADEVISIYELTQKYESSLPPKSKFLGWKCPKCGAKLKKRSLKHPISTEVGGTEFAYKVVKKFNAPPGFYSLNLDHFMCRCGYEYAARKLEKVELE